MKTRNILGVLAIGAVLGTSAAITLGLAPQAVQPAPKQPTTSAGAEAFTIDPVHSSVVFKISHMGVSNFYGRFNDLSGTYSIDAANPDNCKFDLQVKTESVDTRVGDRDKHLKSADFFNAKDFPAITFKSTKAVKAGDKLSVTGDLNMHGVTKSITVEMELFPAKQTAQGYKGGFEATFNVKRSDFKMDKYVAEGMLGDEVTLRVGGEGAKAK